MPQRRFLPAVTRGALLWSVVYTTVGFAVLDAWLGILSWWWAVAAIAVMASVALLSRRLKRSAASTLVRPATWTLPLATRDEGHIVGTGVHAQDATYHGAPARGRVGWSRPPG